MFTPWGTPTNVERLERGITYIKTSKHGGLMLSRGYAETRLSPAARACAVRFGEYYAYEMDKAWAVVCWELPHLRERIARALGIEMGPDPEKFMRGFLSSNHAGYTVERAAEAIAPDQPGARN